MKTFDARRLTLADFAALRAHLQGVDTRKIGELYLYLDGGDPRTVARGLRHITQIVAMLATQHGLTALAAALTAPRPTALVRDALPSFDEFAIAHKMTDWSQADIERAYRDVYAAELDAEASSPTPQAHVSLDEQIDAINRLQQLCYRPPARTDALGEWLSPRLTDALAAVGLHTLHDLIALRRDWGDVWHRRVPRIGSGKAHRINLWLDAHNDCLPPAPPSAHRAIRTVPEVLDAVPVALRGADGSNRMTETHSSTLGAQDDVDAVRIFLRGYDGATLRAYRATLERIVVWSSVEKRKALSDLTIDDAYDLLDFFTCPLHQWIGQHPVRRTHAAWRPLRTPTPTPATIKRNIAVAKAFGAFAVSSGYWRSNVFAVLETPKSIAKADVVARAFLPDEWQLIRQHIADLGVRPGYAERALRLEVALVQLAYTTALRCEELVALSCGQFSREPIGDDLVWFIRVTGKGGRARDIPLANNAMAAIGRYLLTRGLNHDPRENPAATPIIARLTRERFRAERNPIPDSHAPLTTKAMYNMVKQAFRGAARALKTSRAAQPMSVQRLEAASTHWLRHTFCTVALERDVPLDVVQEIAGHRDINMTRVYSKTRKTRLVDALLNNDT
jgi:site-specific recombinase XerD